MWNILTYIGFLWIGAICGYFIRLGLDRMRSYTGALVIHKTEEKTVYSLEIYDFSEIEGHNEVVFKVKQVSGVEE
jgi:hypothetical protein